MSTETTASVDISSTEFWQLSEVDRDKRFAALRATEGLTQHRPIELGGITDGPGFWAIVRRDDIQYVSRHAELFCSSKGVGFTDIPEEYNEAFGSFLMTDAPRHTHLRGLISRAFTPKRVRTIEDQIQRQAVTIVGAAVDPGSVELVADLSMQLPLWTISEMLGVPEDRRRELWDGANALVNAQARADAGDDEADALAEALMAGISLSALGVEFANARRSDPRDDLLTSLVEAEVDGQRLTDEEIGAFIVLLGVAGNDTTRNTITLNVKAFADNPDQWDLLRSDPERYMAGAVEEMLRWATPVMTFRRTATRDTLVAGTEIREGDRLVMFYASGDRDEAHFADPWRFDITRTPNEHVAFGGGGVHYCLGASLARTQLRCVFGELAKRVERFEVGDPHMITSAFVNGVESVACTFVTA